MSADEGAGPLIGRQETHGRRYPGFLERIGFLITIVTAIFVGQWMWAESDWPTIALWVVTICGLPAGTLLLGEGIARIILRIHVSGD